MKRVFSIALVLAAALAACFGAGPTPTPPSGLTVVYTTPLLDSNSQCNGSAVYIGDVAIGAELGYASLVAYDPPNCNNMGPDNSPGSFVSFAKDGSMPQGSPLPSSSMATGYVPRIAANGASYAWLLAFGQQDELGGLVNPPINVTVQNPQTLGGNLEGLVLDDTTLFFGEDSSVGGSETDLYTPSFPCCGLSTGPAVPMNVWKLAVPPVVSADQTTPAAVGSAIMLANAEMKTAMVANSTDLYVMAAGNTQAGTAAAIVDLSKSATATATPMTIDSLSGTLANQITPVGLDANDSYVVWTAAISALSTSVVPGGCWVFARDLTPGGTTKMLLQTTRFSCLDAALDSDSVYFTIVDNTPSNPDNGCNNGNCQQPFHGDGIGRVPLAGGTLESIALGISSASAGPRRIYLDGGDLYAVDPLAIAKIAKSKLDARQDFAP